jgi:seryl-tRNA(Sec) selenium transferase
MSDPIIVSIVGVIGTAVGSLGGAFIGAYMQRNAKRDEQKIERLKRKVEQLTLEIVARQEEEEIAAEWLVELNPKFSALAAKRALRDRTEERREVRPKMSRSDLNLP